VNEDLFAIFAVDTTTTATFFDDQRSWRYSHLRCLRWLVSMHWYKTTAGVFVPSPGKSAHIQPLLAQLRVNLNNDLNFRLIPFKALVLGSSPSRPTISDYK
jgi:hypothetical protein